MSDEGDVAPAPSIPTRFVEAGVGIDPDAVVAKRLGYTTEYVEMLRRQWGLEPPKRRYLRLLNLALDKVDFGRSDADIAAELRCSERLVTKGRRERGVLRPHTGGRSSEFRANVIERYVDAGIGILTDMAVAKAMGVSSVAVLHICRRYHMPVAPPWFGGGTWRGRGRLQRTALMALGPADFERSDADIAAELGYSKKYVEKIRLGLGIRRTKE